MTDSAPSSSGQVSGSIVVFQSDPEEVRSAATSFLSTPLAHKLTVVDNSPHDGLRRHLSDLPLEYSFQGRNLGYGAGHNRVLEGSLRGSKYHLVINPDVHFGPEVIEELYHFMEGHPEIGLVMPRILNQDRTEQNLCKLLPSPFDLVLRRFLGPAGKFLFRRRWDRYQMKNVDLSVPHEVPYLSGCFMFMRTSVLQQAGRFDERFFMYMEDVDLCRRIGRLSKTVFYPCISVTHGYAKGSYRNLKLLYYHVQSAIRYFSKWGWLVDPEREQLNRRTARIE